MLTAALHFSTVLLKIQTYRDILVKLAIRPSSSFPLFHSSSLTISLFWLGCGCGSATGATSLMREAFRTAGEAGFVLRNASFGFIGILFKGDVGTWPKPFGGLSVSKPRDFGLSVEMCGGGLEFVCGSGV